MRWTHDITTSLFGLHKYGESMCAENSRLQKSVRPSVSVKNMQFLTTLVKQMRNFLFLDSSGRVVMVSVEPNPDISPKPSLPRA